MIMLLLAFYIRFGRISYVNHMGFRVLPVAALALLTVLLGLPLIFVKSRIGSPIRRVASWSVHGCRLRRRFPSDLGSSA